MATQEELMKAVIETMEECGCDIKHSWEDGPDSDGEEEESFKFNEIYPDMQAQYDELKEEHAAKCEEHRILQSKYKDLLARFEGLSAKVRAFAVATAIEVIGGT